MAIGKKGSASWKLIIVAFAVIALWMMISGCTPHKMYRSDKPEVGVCDNPDPAPESPCEQYALQQLPTGNGTNYLLGFIEFDDQGQLWSRMQMHSVLDKVRQEAASHEMLMVVFVHGWKHSAAPGDKNINTFRGILARLSDAEGYIAKATGKPVRHLAGIYLGWRGGSVPVPYLEDLTFWDRKNTAQKVGYGGVAEVLSQLESIQATSKSWLAVLGHSFGGAVVHTAVVQNLENRFAQPAVPAGQESTVRGFGSLIVLINPAFEANLFTPLSDMSVERGHYLDSQPPVMAVLTSEADDATGKAFPAGRWLSTLFENEHDRQRLNAVTGQMETISEHDTNIIAVGHFEPYRTHRLYPKPQSEQKRAELRTASAANSVRMFMRSSSGWRDDAPGSVIPIGDVLMERTKTSAGHNPYLVISVDKDLINSHNDIDDARVIEFIKQLIWLSSYKPNETRAIREMLPPAP